MAGRKVGKPGRPSDPNDTQRRIQQEKNRERGEKQKLVPPVIKAGLNTKGAENKLQQGLLGTSTERRGGRIGFYDTLRNLKRQGRGIESQMGSMAAESSSNRRSPALASGAMGVRQRTASGIARALGERSAKEASLIDKERGLRSDYERAVVDAFWARAANMDAQARKALAEKIFKEAGIVVDTVAIPNITGAGQ
jgi:hypothetical protein